MKTLLVELSTNKFNSHMTNRIGATVLLRRPDGSFLMQLRDDGGGVPIPCPNMWNFPGGAVEPNETPLEAAVREIAEEFEIQINPNACLEIWSYAHKYATLEHVFLCEVAAATVPILHEGAAWAWMTLNEISALELGFEQEKIIARIS